LTALYFACLGDTTIDGAVFSLPSFSTLDVELAPDPFSITENYMLVPFQRTNGYNGRDSNSCFHVCGYANEDIDRDVGGGQNSWDRQNS
jgi:hypothetical protein